MASYYRLYFLDAANHITSAQDFERYDDNGAIAYAMECAHGRAVELWSGARLVARVSGKTARTRAA
jgi:hypothetical protein